MAYAEGSAVSCGVRQLSGLDAHPVEMIRAILQDEYNENMGFFFSQVIFSDNITEGGRPGYKRADKDQYGRNFAKYIRDNKLGSVVESHVIRNRNTGNKIKTWIWNVPNLTKLMKICDWKEPRNDNDAGWDDNI